MSGGYNLRRANVVVRTDALVAVMQYLAARHGVQSLRSPRSPT